MAKLIVLFITAFVDMVGLVMVLPLLPYYATEFGANALMVGVLISAFSIAQLAVSPVWGRLSDRYGRRPAILIGLVITAVAYVVFAFSGSVAVLLVSRIVQGIGGGTIGVVQAYVADASPPEGRTKSLGWLTAVTSFGAVVGPAFGSLLDQLGGRRAPGLAAAALALLVAGFAWRFLRESKGMRASGAFAPGTTTPPPTTGRAAIWRVIARWHEPAPRLIWIYAVAIGAFYGTVPTMPLLLVQRMGITEHTVGYIIMYLGGMGVVVRAGFLGGLVDRLGEARLSRLGIVLLAAGLALMSFIHSWPVLILSITLMPLGTAFLFPCVSGTLTRVIPSGERGLYLGVQHTFGGMSRVAFPICAGAVMDAFGRDVPFWMAALLVIATLPLTREMEAYAQPVPAPHEA
jgi:multidrug resistance protein